MSAVSKGEPAVFCGLCAFCGDASIYPNPLPLTTFLPGSVPRVQRASATLGPSFVIYACEPETSLRLA